MALRLHASLAVAEVGGRSIPGIVPASAALMIVVGLLLDLRDAPFGSTRSRRFGSGERHLPRRDR